MISRRAMMNDEIVIEHGDSMVLQKCKGSYFQGLKLFGKSTQDGTPTPENPVPIVSAGDSGQIEVGVYGGNLFDAQETLKDTWLNPNTGQTESVNGFWTSDYITIVPNVVYQIPETGSSRKCFYDFNKNFVAYKPSAGGTFQSDTAGYLRFCGLMDVMDVMDVMVNASDSVVPWEPYKAKQSLVYPTPNGLPGIPVSSGGNYTDESGQQWVCDEVDFGGGVYVKRVEEVSMSNFSIANETADVPGRFVARIIFPEGRYKNGGFESISNFGKWSYWGAVSSGANTGWVFAASGTDFYVSPPAGSGYSVDSLNEYLHSIVSEQNPIVFIAQLSETEEIPLEESILFAYAALHTNTPTTTVMNDAGAGMEVGYRKKRS